MWYRTQGSGKRKGLKSFSLRWKIEAPLYKLEANSSELGEDLHMPGWNKSCDEKWLKADYVFKANLIFTDKILNQIGNDTHPETCRQKSISSWNKKF